MQSEAFLALLQQARDGCEEALTQILEDFRPSLLNLAERRLPLGARGDGSCADVVNEALTAAWQNLQQFRGTTPGEFAGWLQTILLRTTCRVGPLWSRQPAREDPTPGSLPDPDLTPASRAVHTEDLARVQEAVSRLAPTAQEVIRLRCGEGRTFKAIGQATGRSEDAVRQEYNRALGELCELLGVQP